MTTARRLTFLLFALLCLGGIVRAQVPQAGSNILNKATATYQDGDQFVTIDSNEVRVIVEPLEALSLTQDNSVRLPGGATAQFPHRLTNTGNVATDYTLIAANLGGGDFDFANVRIFRDANGNGQLDPGESEVRPGEKISLAPGAFADFVVVATIPPTVGADQTGILRLTAVSLTQGAAQFNTDTVRTAPGVSLRLSKAASRDAVKPNEEVSFTITAQSIGSIEPSGIAVSVDGQARTLVIVRDVIPANTTFVDLQAPAIGLRLYHRVGAPLHTYTTTPPDAAQVDAVAYGVSPFPRGGTVQITLRVRVNANAANSINNTAVLYGNDVYVVRLLEVPSNIVQVSVPRVPPTLFYYSNDQYQRVTGVTGIGRPLFVQGSAASCNLDPTRIEQVPITIRSTLTDDSVRVIGVETGPNTGIFRVTPPVPTSGGAADGANTILEIRRNDVLTARLEDCGGNTDALANILVDPFGVVFDSRTNAPVAGTRVTLIDVTGAGNGGNAGGPARVFDFDGVTPRPSTVITGADGIFQFPQVEGSIYRLLIEPPTAYRFPTTVPIPLLPPGRTIDASGSFGGTFIVDAALGAVQIDVPVDGPAPSGLFIEKAASRRTAEIADFVDYRVRVRNSSGFALTGVTVSDLLPRGFAYVSGSARIGAAQVEPQGTGPRLTFAIGALNVAQEVTISYRVRVGVGSETGDQKNRAQATGTSIFGPSSSNVATATVRITGGVFTTKGILIGKVFADNNRNRIQDKGEDGIPGVRVWVENGTFAITDEEGKYSIYGLSATTHTVKVDVTTLPGGAKLEGLTHRHGLRGSGTTAWADLKNGELQKVNFAIPAPSPEILEAIAKRRAAVKTQNAAAALEAGAGAALEAEPRLSDSTTARGLPASGTIVQATGASSGLGGLGGSISAPGKNGNDDPLTGGLGTNLTGTLGSNLGNVLSGDKFGGYGGTSSYTPTGNIGANPSAVLPNVSVKVTTAPGLSDSPAGGALTIQNTGEAPLAGQIPRDITRPLDGQSNPPIAVAPLLLSPPAALEDLLPKLDNALDFVDLQDGATLAHDQIAVRVKGQQGGIFKLWLNGEEVLDTRVGKKSVLAAKQIEAWEYIGVRLKTGPNTLEITQFDAFANERGRKKITVTAPGKLGRLRLFVPQGKLPADGSSLVNFEVQLVDELGTPVMGRTPITLEASRGVWKSEDLSAAEPGTQIFIEGGRARLQLMAPAEPGDCLIRVSSGLLASTTQLVFSPDLRPLLAAGLLDARFNLFKFRPSGARPLNQNDPFEDDLRKLAGSDSTNVGARGAAFIKGQIQGKYLLTLRYDSQKSDEQLFRDIQPDEFYPVYGDASTKGFDAQSTSRLYVRVDKNQSFLLYGDFVTGGSGDSDSLARYSRSLNGFQAHHETDKFTATTFFSRDNAQRAIDEIPAAGVSGPYRLRGLGFIPGSEKVEIIVRDRNQPGVVISRTLQTRFTDYQIDGLVDGIIFRRPVPSLDADLNPVYIRITYEVDRGGPNFNVGGLTGQFKVSKNLQIGATFVRDQDPSNPTTIAGANAIAKLGANTVVMGEWAKADTNSGNGNAVRLELLHQGPKLQARLFAGRSDADFDNPESLLSSGRSELSARLNYRLRQRTRLLAEAVRTEDRQNGGTLTGLQAAVEQSLGQNLRLQLGVRHADGNGAPANGTGLGTAPSSFTTAFARIAGQLANHPEATLFARYEQALAGESRKSFQVGGDYQLSTRTRLYLTHEFLDSFGGLYALNESQRQFNTRVGIETDYMKNGSLFSEYRIGSGIDGRSAQAAIGLKNLWPVAPGVRLHTSFERIKTLGGAGALNEDGTAAGLGIEWLHGDRFRATARIESRQAGSGDSLLSTAGLAYKPSRDLTFLARNIYTVTNSGRLGGSGGTLAGRRALERFQAGIAYRPERNDKFNALAKYEFRSGDEADTFVSSLNRRVHLLSFDANYQPKSSLQMRLHYAWKRSQEATPDLGSLSSEASAQLLLARITKEMGERWDVSLIGSTLWGGGGRKHALGVEAAYLLGRNLLLSAGFNILGFNENDLAGDEYTRPGVYLRLRWKFDEEWLGRRIGATQDAPVVAAALPLAEVPTSGLPGSVTPIPAPTTVPGTPATTPAPPHFEPLAPGNTPPSGPVRPGSQPGEQ